jgi:hypothetical protein
MVGLVAQTPPFATYSLPGIPAPVSNDFETGDFDGDGDLDLTVVSGITPFVFENVGNSTFTNVTGSLPALPGNQRSAVFVDVDGDGRSELLLTWTGLAMLFRWQGGIWTDVSGNLPAVLATIHGVAAGDVDGDGDQDLVCAGSWLDGGQDQLLTNDGTGVFTRTLPFTGLSFQSKLVDIDGDFDLDAVFARPGVSLWTNDGSGTFTDVTTSRLPAGLGSPTFVTAGDVDGNQTIDLFVGSSALGDRFLLNDGTGTFTVGTSLQGGIGSTANSALADIDGDGDLDLWRGNLNHFAPTLLVNDGFGTFTNSPSLVPPISAWASQADAADLDGDGDPELLLGGLATPVTVFWNLHRHLTNPAPPVPGFPWALELSSQPGYGFLPRFALVAIGLVPQPVGVVLPPWGTLRVDLAGPTLFVPAWFQPFDGPQAVTIDIPPIPGLTGLPLFVQALIEEPPLARFTALVTTVVQ